MRRLSGNRRPTPSRWAVERGAGSKPRLSARGPALIAGLVAALALPGPAAGWFSDFYFFGDSLTDAGTYGPLLPRGTGRFTTNPGPVWSQSLGARYGRPVTPANQGGTDHAVGGARVSDTPDTVPGQPPLLAAPSLDRQIQSRIERGIDPDALYLIWGGANDIFAGREGLVSGGLDPELVRAQVSAAAAANARQVATLQRAGARYLVFANLPDIGATPFGAASGDAALLTQLSGLYNTTALAHLNAIGGHQMRVDVAGLFREVLASPRAFGFRNTTDPACGATHSLLCGPNDLVEPDAAQTYLFADDVHLSTAGHQVVADLVASMLEGPAHMAALAQAPFAVEQAQAQALADRLGSAATQPGAWLATSTSEPGLLTGPFREEGARVSTILAGVDLRPSATWLAGLALGYAEADVDFRQNAGGFRMDETSLTAYAQWSPGHWRIAGSAMWGWLDYPSIERRIRLGTATRIKEAETEGSAYALRAQVGYRFENPGLEHGPELGLSYRASRVQGFEERGADSTALVIGRQDQDSLITSLGWQARGLLGPVRPFARLAWEHEAKDAPHGVAAGSLTLGGRYPTPGARPDSDWWRLTIGATADLGPVTGLLSLSATTEDTDGDSYSVSLSLAIPL